MDHLRFQLQIIVLVLLLALAVDAFISVGITCYDLGHHGSNEPDAARYCSIFRGPLLAALVWFAAFFEEHREALIAAFIVALAISTIGLWWTSLALWETAAGQAADMKASIVAAQQSAEAAKKSAEVAAASVRAILFVLPRALAETINRPAGILATTENRTFTYSLQNFGKLSATVQTINIEVKARMSIPTRAEVDGVIRSPIVGPMIIPGDGAVRAYAKECFLSDADVTDSKAGKIRLFAYGTLNYSDLLGQMHTTGFAFEWKATGDGFMTVGEPNELNYHT